MPELARGKQFLYRLIVSQLQQDGFVNVATSLSIATIGANKIIPSDRLFNLISLCAQVVRDTDAEVFSEAERLAITGGDQDLQQPDTTTAPSGDTTATEEEKLQNGSPRGEMGGQQSTQALSHTALSELLQTAVAKESERAAMDTAEQISAATLKSLQQLQMLKVFSSVADTTRTQPYFQNEKKHTSFPAAKEPTEHPIRPFPLSTPDIKTPVCHSTLLPFANSSTSETHSSGMPMVNGAEVVQVAQNRPKFERSDCTQSIDAMEEIIKMTVEDQIKTTAPTITTTSITTIPSAVSFLSDSTESAIQKLLMQRQLKQRRFKDLDCSFVNKLAPQSLANNSSVLIDPGVEQKPTINLSSVLARISEKDKQQQRISSPPSLVSKPPPPPPGNGLEALLAASNGSVPSSSAGGPDQARFECPRCARVFAYEYVLQTHMRQVCPDRSNYKHPCNVCNKRFQNQSSLKRHMIVHTGERKYECEVCHKRFGRSHHLKRHIKIHEMEAANYTQHHPSLVGPEQGGAGGLPEETLKLILQLGAMNKLPLSPASLIDSVAAGEEGMSGNDCESIDDNDSQGEIDMDDPPSDTPLEVGEVEKPVASRTAGALSIQSLLGNAIFNAEDQPDPRDLPGPATDTFN